MEKIKVIVLGTGNVSSYAVKAMQGRKDMELVGVWAHETAAHDIGKDAGELRFNDTKTGVIVTGDLDELIALKPDCAMMGLNAQDPIAVSLPYAVKLLEAGINVVGTSMSTMIYPSEFKRVDIKEAVAAAAAKGGASFYSAGVHPGFACDFLPAALSTVCNKINNITAIELSDYRFAPNEFEMKMGRGFGEAPEYKCVCEDPGFIINTWGPCVDYIAGALGYTVEGYETEYEKAITDHDLPTGYGKIPAGTVGAVRIMVHGIINGKRAISVGNVNRMGDGVAPQWENGPELAMYRVKIDGDPAMTMDYSYDHNDGAYGYSVTALRALNAAPYVVAAKPGMLSSLDMPLTIPGSVFR